MLKGSPIAGYFAVVGRGQFPVDMLRYDQCWPVTGEDAAKLITYDDVRESRGRRMLVLATISHKHTPDRWSSFGWTVAGSSIYDTAGEARSEGANLLG